MQTGKSRNEHTKEITGADIARWTVYCDRDACQSVIDYSGRLARPSMNYLGTRPHMTLVFWHRMHVFGCSICGSEKRFKRSFLGTQYHPMLPKQKPGVAKSPFTA